MEETSFRVDYVGKRRVDGPRGSQTLVDDVLLQIRKTKRKKSTDAGDGVSADCTFTVNAKWIKLTDSKTLTIHMQKVISSVAYCSQGLSHRDYVGVICEDAKDGHFSCYVLRAAPPKSVMTRRTIVVVMTTFLRSPIPYSMPSKTLFGRIMKILLERRCAIRVPCIISTISARKLKAGGENSLIFF